MSNHQETRPQAQKGLKTTLVGIVVSALLAMVKAAGGILGHFYRFGGRERLRSG